MFRVSVQCLIFGSCVVLLSSAYLGSAQEVAEGSLKQDDLDNTRGTYDKDLPWEQFLTSAPSIVALLGQVTVMASKESVDFPLNEHIPEGGFQYIRYPNSFRASLSAFVHDVWNAFHGAYNAMDTIRLRMLQVNPRINSLMRAVRNAPPKLIRSQASIDLNAIKNIGRDCLEKAQGTHQSFWTVINTTAELIASTTQSKSIYETKLQQAKIELAISLDEQKYLNQTYDENKHLQAKVRAQTEQQQKRYDDIMDEIPTGYAAIGQELVGTIAKGVGNFVNSGLNMASIKINPLGYLATELGGAIKSISGSPGSMTPQGQNAPPNNNVLVSSVISHAKRLLDKLVEVKSTVQKVVTPGFSGNPKQLLKNQVDGLAVMQNLLGKNANDIILANIMTAAIEVCAELRQTLGGMGQGNATIDASDHLSRLDGLIIRLEGLYAALSAAQGKVPDTLDVTSSQANMGGRHADAKFKAHLQHTLLIKQKEEQQLLLNHSMEIQGKMLDLMGRIARVNMETISYKEIIELMRSAVDVLSMIRSQWASLVEFFANVANRVETVVKDILGPYHDKIADGLQYSDDQARRFLIGEIRDNSRDLIGASYYLHIIAGMYADTHSQFIREPLAGLDRLASLQGADQTRALLTLKNSVRAAQEGIRQLVENKRQEYSVNLERRLEASRTRLLEIGGLEPIQQYALKAGVAAASVKKAELEEKNPNPFLSDI